MRVYLRGYDIDKIGYDANGFQLKATQDTNTINGELNVNRSRYVFKNINLASILGFDKFQNNKTFNIKLVEIRQVMENSSALNTIDYTSRPHLRTSNVIMSISNTTFLNGQTENIISQFTNFNPNFEVIFENVQFSSGNTSDFNHRFQYSATNQGGSTLEFYRWLLQGNSTTASGTTLNRMQISSTTITQLNGMIVRYAQPVRIDDNILSVSVVDSAFGGLPARITQSNGTVNINTFPEFQQWFTRRFTDDIHQDDNNNELTAYLPKGFNVDITLELRDILTNRLQPVVVDNNIQKVFPSLEFIFDIY
jgi:hypothetical protein